MSKDDYEILQDQMAALGINSREDLEKEIKILETQIEMELQMMDQKVANL